MEEEFVSKEDSEAFLNHVIKKLSRKLIFIPSKNNFDEVFLGDVLKNFILGSLEFVLDGKEHVGNVTIFIDNGLDIDIAISRDIIEPITNLIVQEVDAAIKILELPFTSDQLPADIAGTFLMGALQSQAYFAIEEYIKSEEEKK